MKLFIFKFSTSTFYIHSHLENVWNEIQWIFSHVFCNIWSLSNSLTFKTYRVNIKIFLRWIVKTSGVYISRKINSAFDFIIFISYHEVNLPIRVDRSDENFPKSILTMVFGCKNASGWAFIKGKNFEKLSQQK